MKLEIVSTLVLVNLVVGQRRPRSTVLTDESKKILEHFDFSNFDKQEALNYLDRQRYDNQIRGKRGHFKNKICLVDGININDNDAIKKIKYYFRGPIIERRDFLKQINHPMALKSPEFTCYDQDETQVTNCYNKIRSKRGHKRKKMRHKHMQNLDVDTTNDNENYYYRKQKKKKKKKKKRYWDKWSSWSPCSVTCGRGRKIRWRKCIVKNCNLGEVEMGEKTCQLPACSLLTKLFGL